MSSGCKHDAFKDSGKNSEPALFVVEIKGEFLVISLKKKTFLSARQ